MAEGGYMDAIMEAVPWHSQPNTPRETKRTKRARRVVSQTSDNRMAIITRYDNTPRMRYVRCEP